MKEKKKNWFRFEKTKEDTQLDDTLKRMSTPAIKEAIENKKKFVERAEKIYDRRKDRRLRDKIGTEFNKILDSSFMIVLFGIIMFGGLASMFGVNNEFTNPSVPLNYSGMLEGVKNAVEVVGRAAEYTLETLFDVGARKPVLWFWLFWISIIYFMIIPIFKICYFIIIKYTKGRENKNGAV